MHRLCHHAGSPPLRAWLHDALRAPTARGRAGIPVFEHEFGPRTSAHTLHELAERGELDARLVDAMHEPPVAFAHLALARTHRPAAHHVRAWQNFRSVEPRSSIVDCRSSSQTAEVALIPVFEHQFRTRPGPPGVRTVFVHGPSLQSHLQVRLAAWTSALPATSSAHQGPLWLTPPGGLRSLLDAADPTELQRSFGALHSVVVDGGILHASIGLLRAILRTAEVDPTTLRWMVLSADHDGSEEKRRLRRALAELTGHAVQMFVEQPDLPDLPPIQAVGSMPDLHKLRGQAPDARFESLVRYAVPRQLRARLAQAGAQSVGELTHTLHAAGHGVSERELVDLLDLARTARPTRHDPVPFLPLRAHLCVRQLWTCLNPRCSGRQGTPLDDAGWLLGAVSLTHRASCEHPGCDGRIDELLPCVACGAERLQTDPQDCRRCGHRHVRAGTFALGMNVPALLDDLRRDDAAAELRTISDT
jgi:hypothetical protein